MSRRDLFSKYKAWNTNDSDDYMNYNVDVSEDEQPAKTKNPKRKSPASKTAISPKKHKKLASEEKAEKAKSESSEDSESDEDLYKNPVMKYADVTLPEITPPKRSRGRPRRSVAKYITVAQKKADMIAETSEISSSSLSLPEKIDSTENTKKQKTPKAKKKKSPKKPNRSVLEMLVLPEVIVPTQKTPQKILATVDLCGPPTPPGQMPIFQKNCVQLIDDDDDLNDSYDADIYKIKVKWQGKVEIHPMRKHQKFETLMQKLADRANADVNYICLNESEKIIGRNETPDSINYKISMFISARVLNQSAFDNTVKPKQKQNEIELKIQSATWKKPKIFKVIKTHSFQTLFERIAEENSCSVSNLKLSFDGDAIKHTDKPSDHDMEGGEILDCNI